MIISAYIIFLKQIYVSSVFPFVLNRDNLINHIKEVHIQMVAASVSTDWIISAWKIIDMMML